MASPSRADLRPTSSRDGVGRRIAVLRSGALGDFVLTMPALATLRAAFPGATISFGGRSEFGALARGAGVIDDVLLQDDPAHVALFADAPDPARLPDAVRGADVVVSYLASDAVAANLMRGGAREVWNAAPVPPAGERVHAADHLAAALRPRLEVRAPAVPCVEVPEEVRTRARDALRQKGLEPGGYLAVHPGSGAPRKNWGLADFVAAADLVCGRHGLKLLVVSGPAEEEAGAAIRAALGGRAALWLERPRLPLLGAVLSDAAAYLGNDSGVSHLAAACGARTVAVFGPTDPVQWAPRGRCVRILRHPTGMLDRVGPGEAAAALGEILAE